MATKYTNGASAEDALAIIDGYILATQRELRVPYGGSQEECDSVNEYNRSAEDKISILETVRDHIERIDNAKRTDYVKRQEKLAQKKAKV